MLTLEDKRRFTLPFSFHFEVSITGATGAGEGSFAEVSGLDVEREAFEIKEGGENRFSHRVPDRAKYTNLVLRRGMLIGMAGLARWCRDALEGDLGTPAEPRTVVVKLLDAEGDELQSWNFDRAWPVSWRVAPFAADKSEIAIETLELAYSGMTRI